MKKLIQKEITEYYCDVCGKQIDCTPVTLFFGYGSILDGEEYHFCCEGETIRFLADEILKEQKYKNGEEKNDQDN